MALMHVHFFSEALKMETAMEVILPQQLLNHPELAPTGRQGKYKTLYLLHGLSGDQTSWTSKSSIERYVSSLPLAVVMPRVDRGFYTDMKAGPAYWSFLSDELPRICRQLFPLSDAREDNYAAGLSMGGYGALKLGLLKPDKYAAVATLSGAVDIVTEAEESQGDEMEVEFNRIFGNLNQLRGSDDDLMSAAQRLYEKAEPKPKIYMACGTEDFLYQNNVRFRDAYSGKLDITYEEGPGEHEWGFWDHYIQRVLKWLPM